MAKVVIHKKGGKESGNGKRIWAKKISKKKT